MTALRSSLLTDAGFEHGFGTKRSTPDDLPEDVHILKQVHGERIVVLTGEPGARSQEPGENRRPETRTVTKVPLVDERPGKDRCLEVRSLPEKPFRFDEGDALVTDIQGVSLGIRTADCLPVMVGDRGTGAVAAIHCGWRSLALGLAEKGVRVLMDLTGSGPEDLLAALGPSIGPCCYEVGEDVRRAFHTAGESNNPVQVRENRLYLDLAEEAKNQLLAAGISPGNIEKIPGCTSCDEDRFWSWRARKEKERMVAFIKAHVN